MVKGAGLTKKQIRSKILVKLKIQKEDIRDRKSRIIKEKLFREKHFKKAKIVMFYVSFGGEVKTEEMIKETLKKGKIVTVPVCKNNGITIRPCILDHKSGFKRGPYGTCEPSPRKSVLSKDIGLVIVPGVAFDKKGNRLGRGRGCYDRFLKMLPEDIPSIGLAFDFQILPEIPAKTHDARVNKIIFA